MSDEIDRRIPEHIAGATVKHTSPFSNIKVPVSLEEPDGQFYDKWVMPFYCVNLQYSVSDRVVKKWNG